MKKRGIKSPDRGDSAALTFASPLSHVLQVDELTGLTGLPYYMKNRSIIGGTNDGEWNPLGED